MRLGTRQQTWLVVDLGGRWIKCARYEVHSGNIRETGSQVIDIQAEGLLSAEEVGSAIRRVLSLWGEHPVAVVLSQASAVSQVMDLPQPSSGGASGAFEEQLLDLIGLNAERCVYDTHPLAPFGGFANPQWTTVAKEENLSRQISPLLAQGLRVEAATTTGNALAAAFRLAQPGEGEAFLVDFGATQTTVVWLKGGEPVQMASLVEGGESWTEALVEICGEAFEEVEARLFSEELWSDAGLGPLLQAKVQAWSEGVLRQMEEWRDESGMSEVNGRGGGRIHLFGGYAAIPGLGSALAQTGAGEWTLSETSGEAAAPVWTPAYGAVLMAAGISRLKASILPRNLAKLRARRQALSRLKAGVLYLFVLLLLVLAGAILKQQNRLEALVAAKHQAEATLMEIEATKDLLVRRDLLAARIEPIVRGQLQTLASLETFRRIQDVQRDYDFTLIRFADHWTYFVGMDTAEEGTETRGMGPAEEVDGGTSVPLDTDRQAFVVELNLRGSQAQRLQVLGEIVGRLRAEKYFANVDRLVGGPRSPSVSPIQGQEAYALYLTLAGEQFPSLSGDRKGTER